MFYGSIRNQFGFDLDVNRWAIRVKHHHINNSLWWKALDWNCVLVLFEKQYVVDFSVYSTLWQRTRQSIQVRTFIEWSSCWEKCINYTLANWCLELVSNKCLVNCASLFACTRLFPLHIMLRYAEDNLCLPEHNGIFELFWRGTSLFMRDFNFIAGWKRTNSVPSDTRQFVMVV